MHINHQYLLRVAAGVTAHTPGARVLDYGCGAGEIVGAGRESGIDIVGVETFYAGGSYRDDARRTGLLAREILEFDGRTLPFEDGAFDLVMSNQVLEHVPDLGSVVSEIARVTRPGGVSVHLFPSRDVWREGHCGVSFLHRGFGHPRVREAYAVAARRAGAGYHAADRRPVEWAQATIAWLDEFCFYRERSAIHATFATYFELRGAEEDYARFRLHAGGRAAAGALAARPVLRTGVQWAFRKLGFLVLVGKRHA